MNIMNSARMKCRHLTPNSSWLQLLQQCCMDAFCIENIRELNRISLACPKNKANSYVPSSKANTQPATSPRQPLLPLPSLALVRSGQPLRSTNSPPPLHPHWPSCRPVDRVDVRPVDSSVDELGGGGRGHLGRRPERKGIRVEKDGKPKTRQNVIITDEFGGRPKRKGPPQPLEQLAAWSWVMTKTVFQSCPLLPVKERIV